MMGFGPELEHERYEELCALATAGVLTLAELELVTAHVEYCAACRGAFAQYRNIAIEGMPFLAGEFSARAKADGFDESSALKRLMRATEMERMQPAPLVAAASKRRLSARELVRGLVAASLVLGVGMGAYWTGARSANARLSAIGAQSRSAVDRAKSETHSLEKALQAGSRQIAALEQQTIADRNEAERLRTQTEADARRMAAMTDAMDAVKNESDAQLTALRQERDADAGKLRDAEKMYQDVQYELNKLRTQHRQDLLHLASLESSVDGLTAELDDQSRLVKTDERYLAADKDIRDLIAARNLYIADIMDVNDKGQSQKAFGRVFYTKTKSLIFYAYDLDRQPGVKRTSTFQVWGRTGPDDRKPINLGILYMDSATNRRWTLRVDNPEQLARLDSIFVTIEPHEQTDRPTGRPFLYASLQRLPNHP